MVLNKKGYIGDIFTIFVVILIVAVVVFLSYRIIDEFNTSVQTSSNYGATSKSISQTGFNDFRPSWDYGFLFLVVGFWLVSLILTIFIDTHPIWYIISWLMLIFMVLGTYLLGNIYHSFVTDSPLTSVEANFIFIPYVMNNIGLIAVVMGFSILIALYSRFKREI